LHQHLPHNYPRTCPHCLNKLLAQREWLPTSTARRIFPWPLPRSGFAAPPIVEILHERLTTA